MSHEIRTPMNAIAGFAEIILRESKEKTTAEHAQGIKGACANLLNLINDILDISKIESGKLEIINSQFELASLLNDVITVSRMRLGTKNLMFITNIDSRLPARLVGDEIRIRQILINFLSNAIKFTQEGHFSLEVSGHVQGEDATLCFAVSDTGMGIAREDIPRLFAEFEQVNTTKNRSIEGTGLGLAISRQLCEMMNGSIQVESTLGKGSIFTMSLPLKCPDYEPLATVETPKAVLLYEPREVYANSIAATIENLGCVCVPCVNQSQMYDSIHNAQYDYILTSSLHLQKAASFIRQNRIASKVVLLAHYGESVEAPHDCTLLLPVSCLQMALMLNGQGSQGGYGNHENACDFTAPSAQVLVVDDNPVNLEVAIGLLAPYRFTVDTATNGLEAVEMVQQKTYDLVFMDHMMPEMDGIDATVAIRQLDGPYKELPIVALTANALVGTREMFLREGMNDFLTKPIEIGKLGGILRKWIPNAKKIKAQSQPPAPPAARETAPPQRSALTIPGVDTTRGIQAVGGDVKNYLQILSVYFADGAQKCVSLPQQVAQGNLLAFRTQVHALKSTSATIGAAELSTMAAKLERAATDSDLSFITGNLDLFLASLQRTLRGIEPMLQLQTQPQEDASPGQAARGDLAQLREGLDRMAEAAEIADISEIERLLGLLRQSAWPEEIAAELAAIAACIADFDYDGILECAARLQTQAACLLC